MSATAATRLARFSPAEIAQLRADIQTAWARRRRPAVGRNPALERVTDGRA